MFGEVKAGFLFEVFFLLVGDQKAQLFDC